MHLNEATLLNNVKIRYSKDKIYVSILISSLLLNNDFFQLINIYMNLFSFSYLCSYVFFEF